MFRRSRADTVPEAGPTSPLDAAAIVRLAQRLRFRVRPGAVSALAGAYHGARPGTGLTFTELRAYEPGDDVRHLDWNVTARQGRPYVRRFVEERALTLWLIVDVSASMRFGPPGRTKADRAAQAAALLAAAAIGSGDRAGLILVGDRVESELAPAGGDRHLARILRTLVASAATSRTTSLTAGLARIGRSSRRALIVAAGDFLDPEPAGPWRRVARRHEVVALRLGDPREETLPDAGLIALVDAESGTQQVVDSGSPRVRGAYARAARRRREAFRAWCSAAGLAGLDLSTAADPLGPLLRFFHDRSIRRGPAETGDGRQETGDKKHRAQDAGHRARSRSFSPWLLALVSCLLSPVLPPRPNPGPEPWSQPRSWATTVLSLSLAFVILGIVAAWLGRRSFRRRRPDRRRLPAWPAGDSSPSPEAPMARWSALVRQALVDRFGPSWGAKTTEEIAAEPGLADRLGPERAEGLVRFLHAADRAKFAGETAGALHGPDWGDWVSAFVAEAGAMSRIKGR